MKDSLIVSIRKGNINAFEELYKEYYVFLCLISEQIVKNKQDAEEIVSDVFVKLWNNRDNIENILSIKAYLIVAVKNSSLNYVKSSALFHRTLVDIDKANNLINNEYNTLDKLFEEEIEKRILKSIDELPSACHRIFIMSRKDNKKYEEIAHELGLSINTVKTQMKIALSRLRDSINK